MDIEVTGGAVKCLEPVFILDVTLVAGGGQVLTVETEAGTPHMIKFNIVKPRGGMTSNTACSELPFVQIVVARFTSPINAFVAGPRVAFGTGDLFVFSHQRKWRITVVIKDELAKIFGSVAGGTSFLKLTAMNINMTNAAVRRLGQPAPLAISMALSTRNRTVLPN